MSLWFLTPIHVSPGFLVNQLVKNLPTMQETQIWSLSWEDPLEEGMATYSNIIAWRIPMDRAYSPWGHKESDMTEWLSYVSPIQYMLIVIFINDHFRNTVVPSYPWGIGSRTHHKHQNPMMLTSHSWFSLSVVPHAWIQPSTDYTVL